MDDTARSRADIEIGHPLAVAARAGAESISAFAKMREGLAGKSQAQLAKDSELPGEAALRSVIYESAMRAEMMGQMMLRLVEVPESAPAVVAQKSTTDLFMGMPFADAVAAFKAKRLVTPAQFRALSDQYKAGAFTASRLASRTLRRRAYDALLKVLQDGGTVEDFQAALNAEEVSLGATPSEPGYVETVFRTNVMSAYGAGRFRQMTDPAVTKVRPYVEYITARDDRVRESHRLLDGTIWKSDDPAWHRIAPPNGYNCRCAMVMRKETRKPVHRLVPVDAEPDDGFDAPPGPLSPEADDDEADE